MQPSPPPEQETRMHDNNAEPSTAPLRHFQSWLGFMFATLAVNLLFVYGMLAGMGDESLSIWYKTLIWLPFNVIATALYLAIMTRLRNTRWSLFRPLCAITIIVNWSIMIGV